MPFRILVVLFGAIGALLGTLLYPFVGVLVMVFITFGRPQDDRPNLIALHVPMMILIGIMVSLLLHHRASFPRGITALKRTWILLLLTFLITVSVVVNPTPESKNGVVDFVPLIIFCVITVATVYTHKRLKVYLGVLLMSGVYVMKTAVQNPRHIVERIGGDKFVRMDSAGHSMFGNANYLALYMVMLICLGLALIAGVKPKWQKAGLLGIIGLAGYVFFMANSRGASIALAGCLMLLWLTSNNKLKSLLMGLILLALFIGFAPDSYWNRLQTIGTYQQDSSATGRLELWSIALNLIADNPVFGVGFMNFQNHAFNSPHDAYLQIASEVGVPALFVYIALLLSGLYSAWQARKLSSPTLGGNAFVHAASQGILCCVLAVTIHGFTTGLAHREVVHVFVCLAYCVKSIAEEERIHDWQKPSAETTGAGFPSGDTGQSTIR